MTALRPAVIAAVSHSAAKADKFLEPSNNNISSCTDIDIRLSPHTHTHTNTHTQTHTSGVSCPVVRCTRRRSAARTVVCCRKQIRVVEAIRLHSDQILLAWVPERGCAPDVADVEHSFVAECNVPPLVFIRRPDSRHPLQGSICAHPAHVHDVHAKSRALG